MILKHSEQWHPYVPPSAKVDSVPIFCGTVAQNTVCEKLFPDIKKFLSLSALYLSTVEMSNNVNSVAAAEKEWIKFIQSIHFSEVHNFLCDLNGVELNSRKGNIFMRTKKVSPPAMCFSLHLCLDDEGIIRVKTSLANAENLSYNQKFPILLPANDPFTRLIICQSHNEAGHLGLNSTRAFLRRKF